MPKSCKPRKPVPPKKRKLVIPEGLTLDESVQERAPAEGSFMRVTRGFGKLVRAFTKHHPELDNTKDALVVDLVRQIEAAQEAGELKAINWVKEITKRMSVQEIRVFQRLLWMRDVRRDFEEGRTNMEEIGFDTVEELDDQLANYQGIAEANPDILDALARRKAITKALTKRLVELKLLRPEVLEDDRYFHRQVLSHLDERRAGVTTKDVRERKSGFQKGRVKQKRQRAFNEDYFESELEWLSQGATKVLRAEILNRAKQFLDKKSQYVRQAKMANEARVIEAAGEGADPYAPFRQRIAIAISQLAKMASNNTLWTGDGGIWGDLVEDLRETYDQWKESQADLDPDQKTPFSFDHPLWWSFIADLAATEGVTGNLSARSIFKTLSDRRTFTEAQLDKMNVDPLTWRDMMEEGETSWSPDVGPRFYTAKAIPEDIVDQVIAGDLKLDRGQLREVLALRPPETWVIPANVAEVFDKLQKQREDIAPARYARRLNTLWKQWVLMNPKRVLKYNINNMSGDLDIAMAYDWRIVRGMGRAINNLQAYMGKREMRPEDRALLDEFFRFGIGTSNITSQEIDRIAKDTKSQLPGFSDHNALVKSWEKIRKYTTLRENILRLTAYRYFKEKLAAGKRPLGASRYGAMQELYRQMDQGNISQEEIAAKLSRELLGDYGNISEGGRWLREKLIPFYSWVEINAPRYYWLFRNAAHDDAGGSKVGTVGSIVFKGAKGVTGAAITVNAFSLLVMAFNYAMGNGDDMEDIFRNRRQLHLIIGRDEEGNVQSLRMQGAWSDAMEWFGLGDLPADIQEFREDGEEVLKEKALDVLKSPINRIYRGISPFYKTTMETLIGYKSYPDVLRSSDKFFDLGYTPVRDRGLEMARVWSAEDLYLRSWDILHKMDVVAKPSPPAWDAEDVAQSLLVYKTDPGQQAYWEARIAASKWAEKVYNKQRGAFSVTETGNALYWWRTAIRMGQEEKANEHLGRYLRLRAATGATEENIFNSLNASLRRQHPLNDIPEKDREAYGASLNQRQADELNLALGWYYRLYGGGL